MKPRKRQPAVTRQAILDAAGQVFSSYGYSGSGIGAIVDACGLTKGALFHHFPDKQSLALAWIAGPLMDRIRSDWFEPMAGIDSLADGVGFCRLKCHAIQADDAMSTLVAFAAETAVDDGLREACEQLFAEWRMAVAAWIERGRGDGWIHPSIQPDTEAAVLVSMFAGFSVMFRCHPAESFRRSCAKSLEGYLETLRPA